MAGTHIHVLLYTHSEYLICRQLKEPRLVQAPWWCLVQLEAKRPRSNEADLVIFATREQTLHVDQSRYVIKLLIRPTAWSSSLSSRASISFVQMRYLTWTMELFARLVPSSSKDWGMPCEAQRVMLHCSFVCGDQ